MVVLFMNVKLLTRAADMELSLDLSLTCVPRTLSELLGDLSRTTDGAERLSALEDFLQRLDEEMRKIEAFKRELPLCMDLMKDAILRLKEQKVQYMEMQDQHVVEKLDLLKKRGGEEGATDDSNDKKSWMSSVQLWSTDRSTIGDDDRSVPDNPINSWNEKNRGGAFVPFNGVNSEIPFSKTLMKDSKDVSQVPNLALMTPISKLSSSHAQSYKKGSSRASILPEPIITHGEQAQQASRKQRRCWSPELHRRFIDALQQLGGPQVATPKQIRKLMHVDGLTNDEVKSHLQKYRLHVRRAPPSSVPLANGLQMSQDQSAETSKTTLSQSDSPQGPSLLGASVRGPSISSGGDSLDDEEDENSDGHSWKGGLHQPGEVDVQS